MSKVNLDVSKLTETQAKELLGIIIDKLEELDQDDFFGTEGWLHFFGISK